MISNLLHKTKGYYFKRTLHTLIPWACQDNVYPHKIIKADGIHLYDYKYNKIMDFTSGLMFANLGHNNKYILKGIQQHMDTGISHISTSFMTGQTEKLSERLLSLAKVNGKVFYTNGGADAVETAIFIAQDYQNSLRNNKRKILSFNKSFHGGSTIGASLISGDYRKQPKSVYFDMEFKSIMNNPTMSDGGESSLQQINTLLQKGDVTAIIIEGSSGSAGCILYPSGYLKKLETLCRNTKTVFICDEIMSGFGRTGAFFAHHKHDIHPDIIVTAKGLTGGYVPLGCAIISKKITDIYYDKPIMHGLTYYAHPLACSVANRCIDLYERDNFKLITDALDKGVQLKSIGSSITSDIPFIKEFRNNGLLGCFEFYIKDEEFLKRMSQNLLKNGIYSYRRQNYLFTAPPLITSCDEIEKGMSLIKKTLIETVISDGSIDH